ncbi:MAG: ABC transporter permease [Puniceicoccaceae bacterium]
MKRYISHFGFAFCIIAKTPLISVLSILVLAISIGQATLMFNMVSSVLFSKLPYESGERLVRVERLNPGNQYSDRNMPFNSYHEFLKLEQVFEGTIAFFGDSLILKHENQSSIEEGVYVSTDFMEVLGEKVILGRSFTAEDAQPENPPVILISETIWNELFARDPDVIGKSLAVDGIYRTVIGVTDADFDFPFVIRAWLPLNTDTLQQSVGWGSSVWIIGKRKAGISEAGATAQLQDVFARIKERFPVENEEYESIRVVSFKDFLLGGGTVQIFVAMGICAILVLLMGCVIASNLITVRCAKRANELAIRTALGASRPQIIVQMLFESLLTTVIAFVLGWLLMVWFDRAILAAHYQRVEVPSWFFNSSYNLAYLAFIIALMTVVTIASSLVPALRASKTSINDLLKDSTRTGSSLRMSMLGRLLIIFQIAAAFAVITGGVIVGYFLHEMSEGERDYNPHEYLYATLTTNANAHSDPNVKVQLFESVKRELLAFPEVKGVTYSTEFYAGNHINPILIEGEDYASPDAYPLVYRRLVAPDYFKVMQTDLIAGREFNELDTPNAPRVVIVTDVFARQFWGNENPIGKRFTYIDGDARYETTVVGVMPDLYQSDRDRDRRTGFFMSAYQDPWFDIGLHVHLSGNPNAFESKLVQTVNEIDSQATVSSIATLYETQQRGLVGLQFIFVMFVTFSLGALLMASAGLYGVVSFSVNQRIREIGIRLALGAEPLRVVRNVFGQGFLNVLIGIIIGIMMAFLLRYLFMMVLNPFVESTLMYVTVLLGILMTSSVSILIPAIRGGTTDPAEALRID